MPHDHLLGWDIGGAHLKAAAVDRRGRVTWVGQFSCPLWQGFEHLDRAVSAALEQAPKAGRHAVTMTGEVTDFFRNRAEGVRGILARLAAQVPAARTRVYAGPQGFVTPERAKQRPEAVASANWAASAELVAAKLKDALFIDIGSTTTDIATIAGGRLAVRGYSDGERLACEELVYTGVVRTPLMALAGRIPFEGEWIAPMAEYFANTADVYRLTGELPEGADQLPAADNGGKTVADSARRLARMLGRDLESAPLAAWKQCARYLADHQLWRLRRACERILSRGTLAERAPLVGAGVGRFLAKKLATQLGRRYRDFDSLIAVTRGAGDRASGCAPAVAVALLAGRARNGPRIPSK